VGGRAAVNRGSCDREVTAMERHSKTVVTRCTVNSERQPHLFVALAEVPAAARHERLRAYAEIGLALATNQNVIELLRIALGDIAVAGARAPGSARTPRVDEEHTERPSEDLLDELATFVVSRA
jgi:hypothetical protein